MENFTTTVTAVGSILTTVVVGAVCVPYVPARANTLKDLGLVTSTIFIPCMLFNHLVTAFTPEAMMTSFILPLATVFGCFVGFVVGSLFCRFFLDDRTKKYKALALMFCTFQNAVVLPLSLIMSVYRAAKLNWLDEAMYEKCVAYVFIYTIPIIIFIWSVGNLITKAGAADLRLIEEKEEEVKRKKEQGKRSTTTEEEVAPTCGGSNTNHSVVCSSSNRNEDAAEGGGSSSSSSSPSPTPILVVVRQFFKAILQSMWNAPFISTLFGLAIGLNPWMASGLQNNFAVVWDAVKILGEGTVPCVLVMLGGNLGSTALPKEVPTTASAGATKDEEDKESAAAGKKAPPVSTEEARVPKAETPTPGSNENDTHTVSSSVAAGRKHMTDADGSETPPVRVLGTSPGMVALTKQRGGSTTSKDVTPTLGASCVNEDCQLSSFSSANTSLTVLPPVNLSSGSKEGAASEEIGAAVGGRTTLVAANGGGSTSSSLSSLIASICAAVIKHLKILYDPQDIPVKVLVMIPLVRLIIVPICAISMFHFVLKPAGLLPPVEEDRALWLVLITEATSPSAININVLCTVHGYMPGTASKMIFYQYSMCVVTMVGWLMFTLWYVSPQEY